MALGPFDKCVCPQHSTLLFIANRYKWNKRADYTSTFTMNHEFALIIIFPANEEKVRMISVIWHSICWHSVTYLGVENDFCGHSKYSNCIDSIIRSQEVISESKPNTERYVTKWKQCIEFCLGFACAHLSITHYNCD